MGQCQPLKDDIWFGVQVFEESRGKPPDWFQNPPAKFLVMNPGVDGSARIVMVKLATLWPMRSKWSSAI
jgi:hypothetical protein